MRSAYTITIPPVKRKPGEETSTRLRRTRPAEKIMMVIFWDKYGILLTEYQPGGTTTSSSSYVSIIRRLRCTIVEKYRGKASDEVLLLHDNVPVHKCDIVQAAIRKASFVELNHSAYSRDIASSDYYLLPNLKKFLRDKNFSRDDETIDTVDDYLNNLDSELFVKAYTAGSVWLLVKVNTLNKCHSCCSTI